MSWDVLLLRFPKKAVRLEQVPRGYVPPAVGSREEVATALRKLLRNVDFAGESFLTIDRARFAIEISLGDDEPCSQLLLHVHDDHEAATKTILRIADHFGMRAIDCSSSALLEPSPSHKAAQGRTKKETRPRRKLDRHTEGLPTPQPPLTDLPGVVATEACVCYVYLSLLAGESPKQLQKAVYRHYLELAKEHAELDAGILGPWYVLKLPDGEALGDFQVARYPTQVTETAAVMIPRVQRTAAFVHAYAAASGRRCGEIENGSTLVCDDGQRIALSKCTFYRLSTDADYARKIKPRQQG